MLGAIKNKSKGWVAYLIVGLLSVPFALFGVQSYIGASNNPVIASVDGEEINATTYYSLLSKQQKQLQEQLGASYTAEIDNALKEALINQLVDEKLLDNFTNSAELSTLTQEIHTVIKSNEVFHVDGVFSEDRYKQLLSLNGFTPIFYEAEQLAALTRDQIRRNLANSGFITSAQVEQLNALATQEREVLFVSLTAANFADQVQVDDVQISQYYDDNQDNFVSSARVQVEFIELSTDQIEAVQDADEATLSLLYDDEQALFTTAEKRNAQHILLETQQDADEVLDLILSGVDFAEAAKVHSTDITSNESGGDLGYFEREHMVPEFDAVVFEMSIGEVSEVVKSDYGYHIIKLNDIVGATLQPYEDVKSKLQALYKDRAATKELYNLQEELASLAYEEPIDIVADQFGLQLQSSEFFSKSSDIYHPTFVAAAYSDLVLEGENSDVLEIGSKFVVLSLVDQKPEQPKALSQVSAEIHNTLQTIKAKDKIDAIAEQLVIALDNGDVATSDAIFSEYNLNWSDATWIKRDSTLPFDIPSKAYQMSKPVDGPVFASSSNNALTSVVIQLRALRYTGEDTEIGDIYVLQEVNEWFAGFAKSLRQSAEIEIFTDLL